MESDLTPEHLAEDERLVAELEALGTYAGWSFSYEYPGFFCYSHPDHPLTIFFTPDWEDYGTLPIEVQDEAGGVSAEYSTLLPLPIEGRTGQKIFNLVRPTLDKLIAAAATADPVIVCVCGWHGSIDDLARHDSTLALDPSTREELLAGISRCPGCGDVVHKSSTPTPTPQDLGRELAATIAYSARAVLGSHDVPEAAPLSTELGNNCAQSVVLILAKHVEAAQDAVRAMSATHGWTAETAINLVLEHMRQENNWQGALDDLVAVIARRGEASHLLTFLRDCALSGVLP